MCVCVCIYVCIYIYIYIYTRARTHIRDSPPTLNEREENIYTVMYRLISSVPFLSVPFFL